MINIEKNVATVSPVASEHPSPLLTPKEILPRLRIGRATLYEWLAKGELPSFRLGRVIRISEADLDGFLERRRRVAPPRLHPYGRNT
jgi:excisionase family DNA binding protein